jgi:hypothetical protein
MVVIGAGVPTRIDVPAKAPATSFLIRTAGSTTAALRTGPRTDLAPEESAAQGHHVVASRWRCGGDAPRRRCSRCGCGARGTGVLLVLQQGIAPVASAARVRQGNRAGGESGPGAAGESRRWRERPGCGRGIAPVARAARVQQRPGCGRGIAPVARAARVRQGNRAGGESGPGAAGEWITGREHRAHHDSSAATAGCRLGRTSGRAARLLRPMSSTTRASQIRRDDLGGRRIRGKTFGR